MRIKRLLLVMGLASFGLLVALWGISAPSSAVAGIAVEQPEAVAQVAARASEGLSPLPNSDWQDDGEGLTDFFGQATAVSDFDYDGNPDYVVGAPLYNNGEGAVFVYMTNGAPQPNVNSPLIITAPVGALEFGYDVYMDEASAGSTIFIGAPGYDNGRGAIYVYGVFSGSAQQETNIFGLNAGERFGESLASFEFTDTDSNYASAVAIGAPLSPGASSTDLVGRVDVFTTTSGWTSLGSGLEWRAYGDNPDSGFGRVIETSKRSGNPHVLYVGAPERDSGGKSNNGAAYIYELDDTGVPNWNVTTTHIIEGDQTGANFGHSLFAADFNYDGVTDIAIGEPFYMDEEGMTIGRVFIETDYSSATRAANVAAIEDIILTGFDDGGRFGYALGVGKLNQSNCVNLLVGAPGHTFTQSFEGAIFAYGDHPMPAGDPCGTLDTEPFTLFAGNATSTALGKDISFGSGAVSARAVSSAGSAFVFGVPHANSDQGTVLAYNGYQTDTVIANVVMTAPTKAVTHDASAFRAIAGSGDQHIFWWDMGDGAEYLTINDSAPELSGGFHSYEKSGEYTITLKALSVNGPAQVLTQVITVVDPISGFTMDATIADAGDVTVFTATVESSGEPFTYRVLFGDEFSGASRVIDPATYFPNQQAGVFTFTHVYSPAGIYRVGIQAYNDINTESRSKYIRVRAKAAFQPGVGGEMSMQITDTQEIRMNVPGAAIGENVTMRITPIEAGCGGIDAPAGSVGQCFDIDVTSDDSESRQTTAEQLSHATTSSCIYLPFMTSNAASDGTGGTAAISAACSSLTDNVYQFLTAVTLTMQYDDSLLPDNINEADLTLRYYSPSAGGWLDGATTCAPRSTYVRDTVNNTISVQICHQSRWAWN